MSRALPLLVAALCACSQKKQTAPMAAAPANAADAGPEARSTQGADISWLVGTWERQSAPKEWLLFNAPNEVGVLAGNPPSLAGRGEFVPNGRSISLFFRASGGNITERVLEASGDHAELREKSANATYRRGAPP